MLVSMRTRCRPSAQATRSLFDEYARTRRADLRDRLVGMHVGLAYALAARYRGHGEDLDDLRQVALIALTSAVERYDPERGVSFSTFATPTILGAIKRHLRDRTWAVRPPRAVHDRYLAVASASDALTGDLGRTPTPAEIADWLDCTIAEVHEAIAVASHRAFVSHDAGGDEDDVDAVVEEVGFGRAEHRHELDSLLQVLDPRNRSVVEMSYFADMTQSDIGARIGVSQMHVSRLLSRSMEALRAAAAARHELVLS
jgi:RNA polymerase sigma-B factor